MPFVAEPYFPSVDSTMNSDINISSSGKESLTSNNGVSSINDYNVTSSYDNPNSYYSSGWDTFTDWLGIGSAGRQYDANQKLQLQQNLWDKYMTDQNNAFNAQEAAAAREYSEKEAKAEREWQEYMSSTAYQRAVADLQKAGLNPILAVGSPASSAAGAMGQVSTGYASPYAKGSLGAMMSVGSGLQGLSSLITTGLMAYSLAKPNLSRKDKKAFAKKFNLTNKEATTVMRLVKLLK